MVHRIILTATFIRLRHARIGAGVCTFPMGSLGQDQMKFSSCKAAKKKPVPWYANCIIYAPHALQDDDSLQCLTLRLYIRYKSYNIISSWMILTVLPSPCQIQGTRNAIQIALGKHDHLKEEDSCTTGVQVQTH